MQAKVIAVLVLTNERVKLREEHKAIQTFNLQLQENLKARWQRKTSIY